MTNLARAAVVLFLAAALTGACNGKEELESATVTVPLAGGDVESTYSTLHAAGLRVSIPEPFGLSALVGQQVRVEFPRPPAVVPRGTVAVLRPTFRGLIGSPGVRWHKDRLPSFIGLTVTEATNWIGEHDLYWEIERMPALPPSDAEHLVDAYVVVAQNPKEGSLLEPGILHPGGAFEVTPVHLTVNGAP